MFNIHSEICIMLATQSSLELKYEYETDKKNSFTSDSVKSYPITLSYKSLT